MTLQLESIYRQRTTQKLQILKMDEHPENDQGQQPRGRRGVRMHGSVQRQNRGRGRRGQGQKCISDEIMLSIMALQWLKGASKTKHFDQCGSHDDKNTLYFGGLGQITDTITRF